MFGNRWMPQTDDGLDVGVPRHLLGVGGVHLKFVGVQQRGVGKTRARAPERPPLGFREYIHPRVSGTA